MRQTIYVETSALVRAVLEGDMPVLSPALTARLRLTSVLTAVETERALLKTFLDKRISAEQRREARSWLRSFLATCELLEFEQDVLDSATRLLRRALRAARRRAPRCPLRRQPRPPERRCSRLRCSPC